MIDFVAIHKASLIGLVGCYFVVKRFSHNMDELERNTMQKKLFDPVKARAQVQVYKEIYNLENQGDVADSETLKIL